MDSGTILSILVLAVIALPLGALALWRRGGSRKQVVLMLVLAAIIAGNIAILTLPDTSGNAPMSGGLK